MKRKYKEKKIEKRKDQRTKENKKRKNIKTLSKRKKKLKLTKDKENITYAIIYKWNKKERKKGDMNKQSK